MIALPTQKKWHELQPWQKAGTLVLVAIQFTLLGLALADLARRPAEEVRGGKQLWRGLVFINFIGPISYLLWGRHPQ